MRRLWVAIGIAFLSSGWSARCLAISFEDLQLKLGVPYTQASITDAGSRADASIPEFIVIQDAHRNAEVQSRLTWLILHSYKHLGVRKVFVEGAFSPIDLSVFHVLNDRERQGLSDHLIDEGKLSGPERAGLQISEMEWRNPPVSPFQLIGMEERTLYQANIAAYRDVIALRRPALQELKNFRRLHDSMNLPATHVLRRNLKLVEKMLELRVTHTEWTHYEQIQETMPTSPRLTPALQAAERFYRLANRRSLAFLDAAQLKSPAAPGPRLLVVGGFHSQLISQILRSHDRSFVVITPRVTLPASADLYERRLFETSCLY